MSRHLLLCTRLSIFSCLMLCISSTANAAVMVSNDPSIPGTPSPDGANLTLDPAQGLKWLDLTVTTNRSYNQVLGELGPGGDYEGFRYATREEVGGFMNGVFGLPIPNFAGGQTFFTDAQDAGLDELFLHVGITQTASDGQGSVLRRAIGRTSDFSGPTTIFEYQVSSWNQTDGLGTLNQDSTRADFDTSVDSVSGGSVGSFLVMETGVPEPSTLALSVFGLVGMCYLRRRLP